MRHFLLIILFISFARFLSAQDPYYIKIDKSRGLPSNAIYGLFQDSKGFIWIGNQTGLTRYDGYEFKTYTNPQQTTKPGSFIQEDKYGRIWYQNFDGYIYYVGNDSMKMLKQNKPSPTLHFAIINDKLYKLQQKGVDIFDLKTLQIIKTIPVDNAVNYRSTHSKNNFYILNKDFFYKVDSDNNLIILPFPNLPPDGYNIIYPGKKEIVLLSRENTIKACFELQDKIFQKKFDLQNVGYIHNFSYTDSCYWFFTPQGVFGFDEDGYSLNNNKAFFIDKSIGCVIKDREGNFWFGSATDGILFVPNINSKIVIDKMKSFRLFLNKDDLYIGTQNALIYKTNLISQQTSLVYKDSWYANIYDLEYKDNNLAFSSDAFKIINKKGKIIFQETGNIKDFEKINEKYYAYVSTGACGLIKSNSNNQISEWDKLFSKYSLDYRPTLSPAISGIRGKSVTYNKTSNSIYFATNTGIFKATPDSVYEIKMNRQSVYSSKVCSYNDCIYTVTTSGKLLKISDKDSIEDIGKTRGVENETIVNIKVISDFLFLMTSEQLMFINLKDGKNKLQKPGIYIREINDLVLWKDKLLIATADAILVQDFKVISNNVPSPKFILNSFSVNNIPVNIASPNQLNYWQNNIEIKYSILSFTNDFKFPLYYKINNNDWELAPAESRILKLSALSQGNYTINFKLGNLYETNFPVQTIQFTILTPWWKSWWFTLSYIVFFLSMVYAYYKYQTKRLIKRNELLAEKNELEKNLNNSILTSIKAQMNPHFFYNSLNAIQSFIITDDKKNATAYLSKFSKLTRMVLEMSEKKHVPLSDELKVLSIYLEIEKLRFNDDLLFIINVASDLDTDMVRIPSMIIQPYVENAIKHGLLHKKINRVLVIDLKKLFNNLIITIDDNGIGRKRSGELNKFKQEKYQPFSTKANQTRLELLNKGSDNKMAVEFMDKVDNNNNATGTTVIITIPII